MAQDTVICSECGKEVPSAADVCVECGARHFRGRAPRRRSQRAADADSVTAIADSVRAAPRRPAPKPSGHGVRKASRRSRSRATPRAAAPPPAHDDAAEVQDLPPGVKRVARRKIYRYSEGKRKTLRVASEFRALIIVVVLGLLLVLMCHLQAAPPAGADPAPARPASAQARTLNETPGAPHAATPEPSGPSGGKSAPARRARP